MPRGPKPGTRPSGRQKGTPNKSAHTVQEILDRVGCNPIETKALICINELTCGVCRGTGRTPYSQGVDDKGETIVGTRVCQSCYGTLYESCSPEVRLKAAAELSSYVYAKRKALEVTGADGQPLPSYRVEIIDVKAITNGHA